MMLGLIVSPHKPASPFLELEILAEGRGVKNGFNGWDLLERLDFHL